MSALLASRYLLMVENPEVTRDNLVFKDSAVRDVDLVPMVGNDDNCAFEDNTLPEVDVSRHGQVVELQNVGDGGEPLAKVTHLFEIFVSQLYQRCCLQKESVLS